MLYPAKGVISVTVPQLRDTYRVPTRDELRELRGPSAPETLGARWQPVHHADLVDLIHTAIVNRGMKVVDQALQIDEETGHDIFGWIRVNRAVNIPGIGMQHEIGFKSSNRQRFRLQGVVAANVFICSNGIITGEFVFGHKHTSKQEYAISIDEGVETWCRKQEGLETRVTRWREIELDESRYNRLLIEGARNDVFAPSQLLKIDEEWRIPRHKEFEPRTAFSFYNCVNEIAKQWPVSRQETALLGCSRLFDREFTSAN